MSAASDNSTKEGQKESQAEAPASSPDTPMELEPSSAVVTPALMAEKGVQTSEVKALCDDLIEVCFNWFNCSNWL